MAKILITGGLGLIGSALTERLLNTTDHDLIVIDDLSSPNAAPVISQHARLNVRYESVESVQLVDACGDADAIVHLAATVGVKRAIDAAPELISSTLALTRAVGGSCSVHGIPLIYASSSEVYGVSPPVPVCEDHPISLLTQSGSRGAYAAGKAASELYLAALAEKATALSLVILRFFNVSGPRQSAASGMVIPTMLESARTKGKIPVVGDGEQTRTFLHVADAARAVEAALEIVLGSDREATQKRSTILNIGGVEPISMNELAAQIASTLPRSTSISHVSTEAHYGNRFTDTRHREPCLHSASLILDWEPKIKLAQLIEEMALDANSQ